MFFFYSFIGWLVESCYCSYTPKKWVNRGFLRGPLCPIYGTGALVLNIVILPLRNITDNLYINEVIVFFIGLVVCDIVEFMTSYIMEKLFNARWWDYSGMKFNIQGRICLTHTLYWGTGAVLYCYIVQPLVSMYFTDLINPVSKQIIVYLCLTVFAADLIDTVIHALGIRSFSSTFMKLSDEIASFASSAYSTLETKVGQITDESRADMSDKLEELRTRYENLKEDFKNKNSSTKKRLFRAFPYLQEGTQRQSKVIEELLDDLKNKFNIKK